MLNALAAASVGLLMGETVENIRTGLVSYTASGMRQNIYEQNGFRIYADCYNASPDAMEATLGVLGTMGDTGRRIAVLGHVVGDHPDDDGIGRQTTRLDILLHAAAQLGPARDLGADHLARRDVVDSVMFPQTRRLRPLAAARRTK